MSPTSQMGQQSMQGVLLSPLQVLSMFRITLPARFWADSSPEYGYLSILHTIKWNSPVQVDVAKMAGYFSQHLVALYQP